MAKIVTPPGKLADMAPTPPVGWPVQFYEKGVKKNVRAGVVDEHNQEPGQLVIAYRVGTVIRRTMNATWHRSVDGKPQSATIMAHGTWDYLPGMEIPDAHYDFAMQREVDLQKAAEMRKQAEEQAKKAYQESMKEQPNVTAARIQQAAMMAAAAVQQGA